VEPIPLIVAVLGVTSLALLGSSAWAVAGRARSDLRRRLDPGAAAAAPAPSASGKVAKALAPLARIAQPGREDEAYRLRTQLAQAGFRGAHAMQIYMGGRLFAALFGLGLGVALTTLPGLPGLPAPAVPVILFACGYYLPAAWLSRRARNRQRQIELGLPEALDLLVTCVEAGLGLDAAMQRVAQELASAYPLLGRELQLTFLEVNAGVRRVQAMRRLADRTGVPDLKSLAATLNQTEVFGTSVGDALRIQSESMRTRRVQRAEELAAMIGVKLSIPLVLFVLPSLIMIVAGPAIINIMEAILPLLRGRR
jgi:tight adherence protein C